MVKGIWNRSLWAWISFIQEKTSFRGYSHFRNDTLKEWDGICHVHLCLVISEEMKKPNFSICESSSYWVGNIVLPDFPSWRFIFKPSGWYLGFVTGRPPIRWSWHNLVVCLRRMSLMNRPLVKMIKAQFFMINTQPCRVDEKTSSPSLLSQYCELISLVTHDT